MKFTILYRATRDGFEGDDFREKCLEKGKTLTIIQTDTDKVFGAYTNIPWKSKGGN